MAALNEAYHVLQDPARRAAYDAQLSWRTSAVPPARRPTTAPPAPAFRPPSNDSGPARFPWKLVAVISVIGAGVVLVGTSFIDPDTSPRDPDNILRPGECVTIDDNGDAREVTCQEVADELVVRDLVSFDEVCSPGMSAHRDRQGLGFACITRRAE